MLVHEAAGLSFLCLDSAVSTARLSEYIVWRVQDLLAAGIAGLQKAINRFDPTRGFKFSTYSHWWIRQTIQRTVIQHGRVIR